VIFKKAYLIILLVMPVLQGMAQDFHFSQFMQTTAYVNPAYAALPSMGEVGLAYRNQWPGIPATFVTYGATVVIPVESLHSGVGISFLNDMQGSGVINRTSASLLYGYLLKINSTWQVGTGINATYVFKRFNADQLVFRSDILNDLGYSYAPVTFVNYSKGYPDFSLGFIARNDKHLSFGVSASHVTRPNDSFSELENSRLPIKYAAFASGRIVATKHMTGKSLVLEPAVFFSQQKQNQELVWGTQFLLGDNFQLGGWFRQNLSFQYESFIISAGISWEHYNISYSYDVNLKKIQPLSTKMAAHEVTFLYRFKYNDKKNKKIECPAYL
jgi:type IX secretion system PorP/SprF family membrane protein